MFKIEEPLDPAWHLQGGRLLRRKGASSSEGIRPARKEKASRREACRRSVFQFRVNWEEQLAQHSDRRDQHKNFYWAHDVTPLKVTATIARDFKLSTEILLLA